MTSISNSNIASVPVPPVRPTWTGRCFCCLFLPILSLLLLPLTVGAAEGPSFQLQRLDVSAALERADLICLDARPRAHWQQGHLPNAFSFSWEDYSRTDARGVKYRVWPPAELAAALGACGIDEQSALLIYGDADSSWGGEGWLAWLLAWLGHRGPVYLLDGGIQAWQAAGAPLNQEIPQPAAVKTYQVTLNSALNCSASDIEQRGAAWQLVDTRSYLTEWLPAHLPGAVHLHWEKFYQGSDRRPLDASQLRQLLRAQGIDPHKPVLYYCTGGIRSGYAWMVHQLAGLPAAINFEGGTEEWAARNR